MQRQPIDIVWDAPGVTFSGVVSAQAKAGELITIKVTPPGGVQTSVTAATNASRAFTASYPALPGAAYKAVASIGADTQFKAAQSPVVTFNVPVAASITTKPKSIWPWSKKARTITLQVVQQ